MTFFSVSDDNIWEESNPVHENKDFTEKEIIRSVSSTSGPR